MLDTDGLQASVIGLMRAANVANAPTTDQYRRVYDDVPQGVTTAIGAYVDIGGAIETEDDSSLSDGLNHIFTFNVWSEHKGFQEVRRVTQNIRNTLHRQTALVGNMAVIMWLDDVLYTVASDGVTRQAIIRVRCACRT
jgi:hypothetical protein